MQMVPEVSALTELVIALEQATLMAKQLPNTTDQSQINQISAALHSAHHHLSSFLFQAPPPSLPLAPPPPPSAAATAENSFSSAVGNRLDFDDGEDEPMQVGDDDDGGGEEEAEAEQTSKTTIDGVEERMRGCFIQNKRHKRPLSPSSAAAAEQRRSYLARDSSALGFDPQGTKLRSLDLVYQFHG
ncbi:hypothetical protein U1Q18_036156 [Sarracenia purpurea var. burkii]